MEVQKKILYFFQYGKGLHPINTPNIIKKTSVIVEMTSQQQVRKVFIFYCDVLLFPSRAEVLYWCRSQWFIRENKFACPLLKSSVSVFRLRGGSRAGEAGPAEGGGESHRHSFLSGLQLVAGRTPTHPVPERSTLGQYTHTFQYTYLISSPSL